MKVNWRTGLMTSAAGICSADDGGAAGGTGEGGGGGGGAAAWHAGMDAEILGHVQTKGWDKLEPAEAARQIAKAHREAQSFIGAPEDRIVRLPKDAADEAGIRTFKAKLGIPDAPTAYKFDGVNGVDGQPLAAGDFENYARDLAFKLDLTPERAKTLASALVQRDVDAAGRATADRTAQIETERAALKQNWGPNHEANQFVAKQGAAKLGVKPEEVAALESVVGYARVMEMFRQVGALTGEHAFVGGEGSTQNGVMTREQAVARKAELMKDAEWGKRYMNGDSAAVKEMTALNTIIVGDDTEWSRNR